MNQHTCWAEGTRLWQACLWNNLHLPWCQWGIRMLLVIYSKAAPMVARTKYSCWGLAVSVFSFRGCTWVSDLPVEGSGPVLALVGWWIYLGRETPSSHCAHLGRWGLLVYGDLENKDAWPIRGHWLWELGKKGCWAQSREDGNQGLTQWQYCFHSTKQSSQVKVGMLIMCILSNKRTMLSLKVLSGVWNTQTLLKNRDIVTFGNAEKYTIYSVRCFSVEKLNALKSQSLLSVRYITFVDIQRRRPKIMEILL